MTIGQPPCISGVTFALIMASLASAPVFGEDG